MNQLEGSVSAEVTVSWSLRCSGVGAPLAPAMTTRLSRYQFAQGDPPRTTSLLTSWLTTWRPTRSNNGDSVRPKNGSYPREAHQSPLRQASWYAA